MKVVERLVEDVAVLELTGKLDCGAGERHVQDVVDDLGKRGYVKIVIDLHNVSHVDTTCLGLLIAAHIRFQRGRGGVRLLRTPPRIRHLLSIIRLDHVLVTFETEDEAIRAFANLRVRDWGEPPGRHSA
jgi:anti-sigma B factor antagonist